jgi:ADP-ribose pyrophosphatase
MEWLATVYPSPATAVNSDDLSACDLTCGQSNLEEGEFLSVHPYPFNEALAMVDRGEILDAKTQVGLLRAARVLAARKVISI